MVDGVEKLGKVDVHCDAFAVLHGRLHLPDRLVCIAARSTSPAGAQDSRRLVPQSGMRTAHKAETRIRERRIEYRREHLGNGLLDHPVHDRGYTQHAFAAAGLGYFYPAHGLRLVLPFLDLLSNRWPVCACMVGEVVNGHAVNARRTFVGLHSFPCLHQVVAGQHVFKQFCCHFLFYFHNVKVSRLGAC